MCPWCWLKHKETVCVGCFSVIVTVRFLEHSPRVRLERCSVQPRANSLGAQHDFYTCNGIAIRHKHNATNGIRRTLRPQLNIKHTLETIGESNFSFDGFIAIRFNSQVRGLFLLKHHLEQTIITGMTIKVPQRSWVTWNPGLSVSSGV